MAFLALKVLCAEIALESVEAAAVLPLFAAPAAALRARLEGHVQHGRGHQQQGDDADANDNDAGRLHADAHRAHLEGLARAELFVHEVVGVVDGHCGW